MARMNALYYHSWRYLLRATVPLLTRIDVRGLEHVPRSGPAMLVGNHISIADPPILLGYVPRHVTFIIKAELYNHLFYRLLLPLGEPIPVRRGRPDRAALRKAESVLQSDGLIAIYPEGTRNQSGAMREAHSGIIFLAQRTGAPIVPVAISGTEGIFRPRFPWYRRAPVRLAFGRPFALAELQAGERVGREELARAVMQRVAELLPPRYRGVYAGVDEPSTHPA